MAGSVNKVTLVGNLGADPEIRNTQAGDKIATFSLATSESWKDRNSGERQERTEWHRVAIFGGLAELAERYLKKGDKVYLEGQLKTRKWQDQSGVDHYTTEIVLKPYKGELVFLFNRRGEGNTGGDGSADWAPAGGRPDIDDDIPY